MLILILNEKWQLLLNNPDVNFYLTVIYLVFAIGIFVSFCIEIVTTLISSIISMTLHNMNLQKDDQLVQSFSLILIGILFTKMLVGIESPLMLVTILVMLGD